MKEKKEKIKLSSVINFRDIADSDYITNNGIKRGVVYRSANPDSINSRDLYRLKATGIRTIVDLRAPAEYKKNKQPLDGMEVISLPMDFERQTREKLFPLFSEKNPQEKILALTNALYLDILDASGPVLRQVVHALISENRSPMLIHCQAGKDRTGIIVALLQLALGAEVRFVKENYLKSNVEILPFYKKMLFIKKIMRFGFFPSRTILFAIEVRENAIQSVLERIENQYGGIQAFMVKSGITAEELDSLKELFQVNHK